MTKAKSRHGKLKGAVLLMVLAVMTVLIIMLAGAMAIASTATNRANANYEESQAYYTARSGVDVLTQTIMGDSKYKSDGSGGLTAIASGSSDKSQALELEEAIAGVLETNGAGKPVYNVSKSLKAWDSINDPQATQLKAAYPSSWQNIIDNSYMEFDVSDISWVDGTSGMMADPGDGKVKVKIQLLKLIYDDGSGAGINRNAISAAQSADLSGGSSSTYYIKDLWVLMECTATYNGISATVSKVITPVEKEKATNVGFTSVGTSKVKNNVSILGGAVTGGDFDWGNDGTVVGSIFVNGNLDVNAQKGLDFKNGESFVVNGNYTNSNNVTIRAQTSAGSSAAKPFMFVNGTLFANDQLRVQGGATNADFDIITKNYQTIRDNFNTIKGDLYIDGFLNIGTNCSQQISSSKSFVDGNIFISDREEVDYMNAPATGYGSLTDNVGNPVNKTYIGGMITYGRDATNKKLTFNVGGNLWNNTLRTATSVSDLDAICTGKIYYYYKETLSAGVTKYSGCVEMHALKEMLINNTPLTSDQVEQKFVETDDINMKYIIQMNRNDFVNGLTVSASDVSCASGSTPSLKMLISLPKDATTRTTGDDRLSLPTLFSKYSQYFCFDTSTCDFTDRSGTAITDFNYTDHAADPAASVTQSWKGVLKNVYNALNPANTNIEYDKEFTRTWDVLCALYKPSSTDMNVQFRTPAQQAQVDGVGTFSDKDDLASITTTVKKISDLTPYTGNSNYLEVDTSSGNVILQLDPTGAGESCYGGGNNTTAKKGIIVKGTGYLYILLPKTGANSDNYSFKGYLIAPESYIAATPAGRTSNKIAIAKSVGSSVPLVAAPKIMWYADDGVTLQYFNGESTTLMGYLYGPGAKFTTNGGLRDADVKKDVYYNGATVKNQNNSDVQVYCAFMGSAFVGDIFTENDFGLVYIPPEETKQPHEAKFSWQTGVVGYSYNGIKTAPVT